MGGHYCYFLQVTPQAGPTESFNLHEGLDQVHIGCHDQLHLPWGGLVQKDLEQQDVIMTHSQMLGKFEYTRGPIFKVVLEC